MRIKNEKNSLFFFISFLFPFLHFLLTEVLLGTVAIKSKKQGKQLRILGKSVQKKERKSFACKKDHARSKENILFFFIFLFSILHFSHKNLAF
jgi:hypothetical protein